LNWNLTNQKKENQSHVSELCSDWTKSNTSSIPKSSPIRALENVLL